MQSLTIKQAAYDEAYTAFKTVQDWGWDHLADLKGCTVLPAGMTAASLQKDIDTYNRLQEELRVAKRRLKNARWKANRRARNAAHSSHEEPSVPNARKQAEAAALEESESEGVSASACGWRAYPSYEMRQAQEEAKAVAEVKAKVVEPINYHEAARQAWQSQNTNFYCAKRVFRSFTCKVKPGSPDGDRSFSVKDGAATFQVAKDGACYEGLGLDVDALSVAELKRWASVLQAPYASKLRRYDLSALLQPVLAALANGPARPTYRW
jgi:hypothetical protein